MRKILVLVVIILLGILGYNLVFEGIEIGNIKVASISSVKALGEELDKKIQEATAVTTITFNNSTQALNTALKTLSSEKEKYEDKVKNMTEEEIKRVSQKQVYEIETIWVKLGKYAKENGVVLKLDISIGNSGDDRDKDLAFTVTGSYIGITDFVYDLEDDENLKFKIENFKLVPSDKTLQGTFYVRDIAINVPEIGSSSMTTEQSNETTNNTQTKNQENDNQSQ